MIVTSPRSLPLLGEVVHRWQGAIEDGTEVRVALHTRSELVPELIERIEQDHPYEVPCVLALSIDSASPAYVEWVHSETGPEA
jgi:periplasmic divalent cation tolerance protein